MLSRCCSADICQASSLYSSLDEDFFICSQCGGACDRMVISEPGKVNEMSTFDEAVNYVLSNEGGLVENPHDSGGMTNFGISLRFLKAIPIENLKRYGIFDDPVTANTIRHLTVDQAKAIYKGEFWDHAPFQNITLQNHCNYLFDMAVNVGIAPAIKCVQRACWAVMRDWKRLPDDGILGDATIAAIKQCGFLIMPALRAERGNYYRMVANQNPNEREFLDGWYNRTYLTP